MISDSQIQLYSITSRIRFFCKTKSQTKKRCCFFFLYVCTKFQEHLVLKMKRSISSSIIPRREASTKRTIDNRLSLHPAKEKKKKDLQGETKGTLDERKKERSKKRRESRNEISITFTKSLPLRFPIFSGRSFQFVES